jgi:predicted nucleic acid-binding protein
MFDARDAPKQERTRTIIEDLGAFVLSPQILGELYVTVTRKLTPPMADATAVQVVGDLSRQSVVSIDAATVRQAITTSHRSQLSYWDALIIEAAVAARCERILTEDLAAGSTIRGVEIVNPFA